MAATKDRPLKPQHREFVRNYTDRDRETYGNATRSYMEAYPNAAYSTAMVEGHRLTRHPQIQKSIETILEENDAGYEVRLKDLIELARGMTKVETVTEQYDSNNTLQSKQLATRDVSPADRIKALKLLSDLTGETQASRARGEILSKALKAKSAEMLKRVEKMVGSGGTGGSGGGAHSIHSPSQIADGEIVDPLEGEFSGYIVGDST